MVSCCAGALPLVGCQATRPVPEPAASIGAGEPIIFRPFPGDVDAADELPGTLSLPEAMRLALRHDASIQAALARVRAAEAEADQAALLPNPILSVVGHFPRNRVAPEVEVGLSANLIAVLQRPGRITMADSRLRESAAAAVTVVLDVVAEVQQTYHAVQSLQASVPLLEARRDLVARLQELSRARLEAGEASRLDSVTLDAEREGIEAEIDELRLELEEQRLALARLIGQPSTDQPLRLSSWQAPDARSAREQPWIEAALRRRPEIEARRWELAALGAEARLNRLSPFSGALVGGDAEKLGDWAGGPAASVPLPVFDWGQARRAEIRARQIESWHLLTQTQREIIEQVRRAVAAFNESAHQLARVRTRLIPLQEQRRSLAEAAFRAGQTDVITVILAEQDLTAARTRAVTLERRHSIALVRLVRAVGGAGAASSLVRTQPSATSPSVVPEPTPPPTTQAEPANADR